MAVAALACSKPNPAFLKAVDGSVRDVGRSETVPGDGPATGTSDTSPETLLPEDSNGSGLDALAPIDLEVSDRPPLDGVTTEPGPMEVAPPPPEVAPDAQPADVAVNPMDAAVPKGTGLWGSYFDGTQLEDGTPGTLDMEREDATINFDWPLNVPPDPRIDHDYFSVRWTGGLMPLATGTYTFTTITDDGVRLWVNGVQVLQNWTAAGATTNTGSIDLVAYQKVAIRMEYRESTQRAMAKLYWTPPGQPMQIIPQMCLFPVFP